MTSNEHLTDEQAIDFVSGRVSAADVEPVAAHLKGCSRCGDAVALWRRVTEAAGQRHTAEPPAAAVRRAFAVFDPALLPAPAWKRAAAFVFDSRGRTALAGVRDAGASFQLLAEAEGLEVDLLCEPEGAKWRITGQVVGPGQASGGSVHLLGADYRQTELNDAGEFVLREVSEGEVSLELELVEFTLTLEPFRLGGHAD
jgi:hypothetical protein